MEKLIIVLNFNLMYREGFSKGHSSIIIFTQWGGEGKRDGRTGYLGD